MRTIHPFVLLACALAATGCGSSNGGGDGGRSDSGAHGDGSVADGARGDGGAGDGGAGGDAAVQPTTIVAHADGVTDDLAARVVAMLPGATDDASLRPNIVYPYDQTEMPPNLYRVEWQWQPVAGADVYLTTFSSPLTTVHYVSTDNKFLLAADTWRALTQNNRGRQVTVTVRAARQADLSRAGSAHIQVAFAYQDLQGGLYYFTTNAEQSQQGIYRYDFGVPVPTATRFLSQTTAGGCVGCHALSRSGDQMGVTFEGGYGYFATLQVSNPTRYTAGGASGPQRGAFLNYFDSDRGLLALYDNGLGPDGTGGDPSDPLNGQIRVYDAATGVVDDARQVPIGAGHRAAHVAVAPDGVTVAYVDYADRDDRPIHETQGSIYLITYDPAARRWGTPRELVHYDGTNNNYYPSFSPDGHWLLFDRAHGDAYDNADAGSWVVPVDGSHAPIELASANRIAHATNSWPRWAPFVQTDELGTARMWFTFSSKRDYGVELVGQQRAQIWMAAFHPVNATSGQDGSAPAFWLPFQDMQTQNHTANWTEHVVSRDCQMDSDCQDPTLRCNVTTHTCESIEPPG